MSNKPENTCAWEIRPCPNPVGWTSVGYILRGLREGTWVPVHHWHDKSVADLHMFLLNRGVDRETALNSARNANDQPA